MEIGSIYRRDNETEEAFLRRGRCLEWLINGAFYLLLALAAAIGAWGCPEDPAQPEEQGQEQPGAEDPASA